MINTRTTLMALLMLASFGLAAQQKYDFSSIPVIGGFEVMPGGLEENDGQSILFYSADQNGVKRYIMTSDEFADQYKLTQNNSDGAIRNEIIINSKNKPLKATSYNAKGFKEKAMFFNKAGYIFQISYYDSVGITVTRARHLTEEEMETETRRFFDDFRFKYAGQPIENVVSTLENFNNGIMHDDDMDFLFNEDGPIARVIEEAGDPYVNREEREKLIIKLSYILETLSGMDQELSDQVLLQSLMEDISGLKNKLEDEKNSSSLLEKALITYLGSKYDLETMVEKAIVKMVNANNGMLGVEEGKLLFKDGRLMEYVLQVAINEPEDSDLKEDLEDRAELLLFYVSKPSNMNILTKSGLCSISELSNISGAKTAGDYYYLVTGVENKTTENKGPLYRRIIPELKRAFDFKGIIKK
jgi:hypothetical protein